MTEGQVLLNAIFVRGVHSGGPAQATPALGILGLAKVPPTRARAQDLAGGSNLKSLCGRLLGLDAFRTSHKSALYRKERAI